MAKLNKYVIQFGAYRRRLNWLRATLIRERVSQADFALYLRMEPKNLSRILNGYTVPNAALFDYMCFLFSNTDAHRVFLLWLFKHGRSSVDRFRSRRFVPIDVPQDYD